MSRTVSPELAICTTEALEEFWFEVGSSAPGVGDIIEAIEIGRLYDKFVETGVMFAVW